MYICVGATMVGSINLTTHENSDIKKSVANFPLPSIILNQYSEETSMATSRSVDPQFFYCTSAALKSSYIWSNVCLLLGSKRAA